MSNNAGSRVVISPVGRLSYCSVDKPRKYIENGQPKGEPNYQTELLFEPDDLTKFKVFDEATNTFKDVDLRIVCMEVAKEKWPDINVKAAVENKGLAWPIKDGTAEAARRKKNEEALTGKKLIRTKSNEKIIPSLYARENGKRVVLARGTEAGDRKINLLFQSGNYAFAELNVKAGEAGSNRYVTCYLSSLCYIKDGAKLGGGPKLMERFDGIVGGEADHDPTKDMNDEIPF